MELTFPFRNLTFNELAEFFEKKTYLEYQKSRQDPDGWQSEYFGKDIENFRDNLPNFENEILQIINTTNQDTIDRYFGSLEDDLKSIISKMNVEYLQELVRGWNEEILNDFELRVSIEEEQYWEKEDREKYYHLQEYVKDIFYPFADSLALGSLKKIKVTNYNYYCIEKSPELLSFDFLADFLDLMRGLAKELVAIVVKYHTPWSKGEIREKFKSTLLPVIFFEGDIDITLFKKAAELFGKTNLLGKVELQQRGSYSNLNKIWTFFKEHNIETIPQTKILIYDCDVNKTHQSNNHIHKRGIPQIDDHLIKKGIENLFPVKTILRAREYKSAMIDYRKTTGTQRGRDYTEEAYEINSDEKTNFCNWVVENGTKEDFAHFSILFEMIEEILG